VRALTQTQFGNWLTRLVRGLDFGVSYFHHRPVSELIRTRMWITIELNLWALFLTYLIAIPIGVYSATHPRTVTDAITTVVLFLLYSLPLFWVGAMLILLFTGPPFWDVFPAHGTESSEAWKLAGWSKVADHLWHIALPVLCLTYGEIAYISRQMRAGMLEVIRQDYVRTARAKGLPERLVVYKHALRNSLIPTITILGFLLPAMFGGSVIVETIFSINGIGRLMFDAVVQKDLPIVMADVFISGVLTLAGLLMADIAYAIVDPRIELR
jgi:peptide/nickel transport system permease protein